MRYRLNNLFQIRVATLELPIFEAMLKGVSQFEEMTEEYVRDPLHGLALEHATNTLFAQIDSMAGKTSNSNDMRHAILRYINRNANRTTPFGLFVAHRAYINSREKAARAPALGDSVILRAAPSASVIEMEKQTQRVTQEHLLSINAAVIDYEGYYLWTLVDDSKMGTTKNARLKKTQVLDEIVAWQRERRTFSLAGLVDFLCQQFPSQERKDIVIFLNRLVDIGFLRVVEAGLGTEQLFSLSLFPASQETSIPVKRWLKTVREKATMLASQKGTDAHVGQELFNLELNESAEIHLSHSESRAIEEAIEAVLVTSSFFPEPSHHIKRWEEKFTEHYGVENYVPLKRALNPLTGVGPVLGYMNPAPIDGIQNEKYDLWNKNDLRLRLKMMASLSDANSDVPYVDLGKGEFVEELKSRKKNFDEKTVYPSLDFSFQVGITKDSSRVFMMHSDACALGGHTFARLLDSMDGDTRDVYVEVMEQLANDKEKCRAFGILTEPLVISTKYLAPQRGFAEKYVDTGSNVGDLSLDNLYLVSDGEKVDIVADDDYGVPIRFNLPSLLVPLAFSNEARFLLDISRSEYKVSPGFSWCQLEGSDFLPEVRFNEIVLRPAEWRIVKQLQSIAKQASKAEDYCDLRQCLLDWGVSGVFVLASEDNRLYFNLDSDISLKAFSIALKNANEDDVIEKSSFYTYRGCWFNTSQGVKRLSTELICSVSRKIGGRASDAVKLLSVRHDLRDLVDEDWMSITLVTASTVMDELIKVVGEFCLQNECVAGWFYVRYNDFGTSLRVRIRLAEKQGKSSDFLRDFIGVVKNSALINHWYLSEYVPEIARYSDGEALKVVHEAFSISTELALAYVYEIGSNENISLMNAAVNLIMYTILIGVHPSWLLGWLPKEHPTDEARQVWREHGDDLLTQYVQSLSRHPQKNETIFSRLLGMHSNEGDRRVAQIILDLLHMHCNRLKGSGDSFETDILWILQRCFHKITVLQKKGKI